MLVTNLKKPVSAGMDKVDKLIYTSLHSEIPLIQEVATHMVKSGGKRLRPLLVLLCAQACGYKGSADINMAVVIEFIHTATLLHDDVVDSATLRRGKDTANKRWGNEIAVLVGDFLYSRAFQLMIDVANPKILQIIANATNAMASGEVLQLLHQHDPATSEVKYLHMIRSKTAKLFEAATEIGAILAGSSALIQNDLAQFGLHLGTAYQLIDDLLDYQADQNQLGKTIGIDLAEGKLTMPLIYLCKHGTTAQKDLVISAIQDKKVDLPAIQIALKGSGALEYTFEFAQREANLAKQGLAKLPASEARNAALELTDLVVTRNY